MACPGRNEEPPFWRSAKVGLPALESIHAGSQGDERKAQRWASRRIIETVGDAIPRNHPACALANNAVEFVSQDYNVLRAVGCQRADRAWEFLVWAPGRQKGSTASFRLAPSPHRHDQRSLRLPPCPSNIEPCPRYLYRLDDIEEYPDPASRFQPAGVHGPFEIIDLASFEWTDASGRAPSLEGSIFYELHVGTYSETGSLDGAVARLAELECRRLLRTDSGDGSINR